MSTPATHPAPELDVLDPEGMARHWIDRYASGLDGEPQLDRIRDALTAPAPAAGMAVTEEQVEAACRAHAPQWDGIDPGIQVYARQQMRAAIQAALAASPAAPEGWHGVLRNEIDTLKYSALRMVAEDDKDDALAMLEAARWLMSDVAERLEAALPAPPAKKGE